MVLDFLADCGGEFVIEGLLRGIGGLIAPAPNARYRRLRSIGRWCALASASFTVGACWPGPGSIAPAVIAATASATLALGFGFAASMGWESTPARRSRSKARPRPKPAEAVDRRESAG